jgi:ribonuclease HII
MVEMAGKYPQYGFEKNVGYGTAQHIAALKEFGPCEIHRCSFIKNFTKE